LITIISGGVFCAAIQVPLVVTQWRLVLPQNPQKLK